MKKVLSLDYKRSSEIFKIPQKFLNLYLKTLNLRDVLLQSMILYTLIQQADIFSFWKFDYLIYSTCLKHRGYLGPGGLKKITY